MSFSTRLRRLAVVAAVLAPLAHAQTPYDCFPDLTPLVFGSDPVPDPYPDDALRAPDATQRRATPARTVLGVRPASGARLSETGHAVAARRGGSFCASDAREQFWDSGAWGPDLARYQATYDAAGRLLSLSQFSGDGVLEERLAFTYDAAGRWIGYLSEDAFGGSTLQPERRTAIAYDADGRPATLTDETATSSGWMLEGRTVLGYGGGPYATALLAQTWDGSAWADDGRRTYTYTADDRPATTRVETRNGNVWENAYRYRYAYDGSGRLTAFTEDEPVGPAAWEPAFRDAYDYDAAGRVAASRSQGWTGSAWQDGFVTAFAYAASGRLSEATGSNASAGGTLVPNDRDRFAYADGALAERISDGWTGSDWVVFSRDVYARDASARPTEIVFQNWTGTSFANSFREILSYDGATSSEAEPDARPLALTVGPNPTRARATVRFALDAPGPVRVVVADALGREVRVLERTLAAGAQALPLSAARLAPGLYVVRVFAEAQTGAVPLVVAR